LLKNKRLNKDKILEDLSHLQGFSAEILLPLADEGENLFCERRGQLAGTTGDLIRDG